MDKEQLAKIVSDKISAALAASEHPKKFFITANGRGVTDGGDLYNALLKDVLGVVSVALVDIFQELAAASTKSSEKQVAAKPAEKLSKGKK